MNILAEINLETMLTFGAPILTAIFGIKVLSGFFQSNGDKIIKFAIIAKDAAVIVEDLGETVKDLVASVKDGTVTPEEIAEVETDMKKAIADINQIKKDLTS